LEEEQEEDDCPEEAISRLYELNYWHDDYDEEEEKFQSDWNII
jgi:hypothetical protein